MISAALGTDPIWFDTDGRQTQVLEPSGSGVDSPADITYSYYPDGHRQALSVSSTALTQSNVYTYSYKADGRIKQQAIAQGVGSFNWTYTSAGRMQTMSDPLTGEVVNYFPAVAAPLNNPYSTAITLALSRPPTMHRATSRR